MRALCRRNVCRSWQQIHHHLGRRMPTPTTSRGLPRRGSGPTRPGTSPLIPAQRDRLPLRMSTLLAAEASTVGRHRRSRRRPPGRFEPTCGSFALPALLMPRLPSGATTAAYGGPRRSVRAALSSDLMGVLEMENTKAVLSGSPCTYSPSSSY